MRTAPAGGASGGTPRLTHDKGGEVSGIGRLAWGRGGERTQKRWKREEAVECCDDSVQEVEAGQHTRHEAEAGDASNCRDHFVCYAYPEANVQHQLNETPCVFLATAW